MKNQKKLLSYFLGLAFLALYSCENEQVENNNVSEDNVSIINKVPNIKNPVTDAKVLEQIRQLQIDGGIVTEGDFYLPDGSIEKRFFIGDDITITQKQLDQRDQFISKQYRTTNLVLGENRNIIIFAWTRDVSPVGLTAKGKTALERAVANYNSINNMALNFSLRFNSNSGDADMIVYDTSDRQIDSGGAAGFPFATGEPNKFIQIFNLESFSTEVNEHVITHEIGHSIGFRHTDWFDRRNSCGNEVNSSGQLIDPNEGATSEGANHIAGTPTGFDSTSLMVACFSSNEDGNFNNNDIIALRNMYPEDILTSCTFDISNELDGDYRLRFYFNNLNQCFSNIRYNVNYGDGATSSFVRDSNTFSIAHQYPFGTNAVYNVSVEKRNATNNVLLETKQIVVRAKRD